MSQLMPSAVEATPDAVLQSPGFPVVAPPEAYSSARKADVTPRSLAGSARNTGSPIAPRPLPRPQSRLPPVVPTPRSVVGPRETTPRSQPGQAFPSPRSIAGPRNLVSSTPQSVDEAGEVTPRIVAVHPGSDAAAAAAESARDSDTIDTSRAHHGGSACGSIESSAALHPPSGIAEDTGAADSARMSNGGSLRDSARSPPGLHASSARESGDERVVPEFDRVSQHRGSVRSVTGLAQVSSRSGGTALQQPLAAADRAPRRSNASSLRAWDATDALTEDRESAEAPVAADALGTAAGIVPKSDERAGHPASTLTADVSLSEPTLPSPAPAPADESDTGTSGVPRGFRCAVCNFDFDGQMPPGHCTACCVVEDDATLSGGGWLCRSCFAAHQRSRFPNHVATPADHWLSSERNAVLGLLGVRVPPSTVCAYHRSSAKNSSLTLFCVEHAGGGELCCAECVSEHHAGAGHTLVAASRAAAACRAHLLELADWSGSMPEALPRLAVEVGPSKVEASGVPEQTIEARSARGRGAETSLAALIKALEGSKTELEGAAAAATETAHATRDAIIAAANARCAALVAAIETELKDKTATLTSELSAARLLLDRLSTDAALARKAVAVCTDVEIVKLHAQLEDRLSSALCEVVTSLPQESQCDRTLLLNIAPGQLDAVRAQIDALGQIEAVTLAADDVVVAGPTDGALVAPGSTVRLVVSVTAAARARLGFDPQAAMSVLESRVASLGHGAALYSVGSGADGAGYSGMESTNHGEGAAESSPPPVVVRENLPLRALADADACSFRVSFDIPPALPPPASVGSGWGVFIPGLTLRGEAISGLPLRLAIVGTAAVAVRAPQSFQAHIDGNYVTPAVAGDGTVYVPQHKTVLVFSAQGAQLETIDAQATFGVTHVYAAAVDDERDTLLLGSSSTSAQLLCISRAAGHAVAWSSDLSPANRTYGVAIVPGIDRVVIASYGAVQAVRTLRASDGVPLASFEVGGRPGAYIAVDRSLGTVFIGDAASPFAVRAYSWVHSPAVVEDGKVSEEDAAGSDATQVILDRSLTNPGSSLLETPEEVEAAGRGNKARPMVVVPAAPGRRTPYLVVGLYGTSRVHILKLPSLEPLCAPLPLGLGILVVGLAADASGTALLVADGASKSVLALPWPLPGMPALD